MAGGPVHITWQALNMIRDPTPGVASRRRSSKLKQVRDQDFKSLGIKELYVYFDFIHPEIATDRNFQELFPGGPAHEELRKDFQGVSRDLVAENRVFPYSADQRDIRKRGTIVHKFNQLFVAHGSRGSSGTYNRVLFHALESHSGVYDLWPVEAFEAKDNAAYLSRLNELERKYALVNPKYKL
jgi:hypothetical protein